MPYISQGQRDDHDQALQPILNHLSGDDAVWEAGDLNYIITKICDAALGATSGLHYYGINEVMGVLSCVQQEFYRRVAAPYEDFQCSLNGEVYTGV